MKKEKEKKYFYPCACPPNFLPILGRKHFCPFFFPILPKIHQTKHTLCVPIFIKSHTKKLNKRWASIPIKKRKKKRKKRRRWAFIKFFYAAHLLSSRLCSFSSNPIQNSQTKVGHLSNSSMLRVCSCLIFASPFAHPLALEQDGQSNCVLTKC